MIFNIHTIEIWNPKVIITFYDRKIIFVKFRTDDRR